MTGNPRGHPQPPEGRRTDGAAPSWGGESAGPGPGAGARLVLDQRFDGDSLFALRSAVAAHASRLGMPQGRVYDFVTVVHELAANAVRHGAGHGRVMIWQHGDTLFCQVTDDGTPQPPGSGSRPDDHTPAPPSTGHGHGLWLIRQLAEDAILQIRPEGTTATLRFTVAAPVQAPPC
jgi:anti-sigma regulatory factor (Ser/Thr protein kinase)